MNVPTKAETPPRLLVIASTPVWASGGGLVLDVKFVEGMRFYARAWGGEVDCALPKTSANAAFSAQYEPKDLPFGVHVLAPGSLPDMVLLSRYDVILASGDDAVCLDLARICAPLPVRLYYVIEYILETRLQILGLERGISLLRKGRRALRLLVQERQRRRAFQAAAGLQANGAPAAEVYVKTNPNTLTYLDNRIRSDMAATETEVLARQTRLAAGGRIRLIHSGRLEPLKGAQDLVPVAVALQRAGVDFELHIFGTGSLEPEIRVGIAREGLIDRVFLQGVADFETGLVPFARTKADLFLSCHRQSDPSCTYLESMACGLPVVGYDNRMMQSLMAQSGTGWAVRLGDVAALGQMVTKLAGQPQDVAAQGEAAWRFAQGHLFEAEFTRRIAHLAEGLSRP